MAPGEGWPDARLERLATEITQAIAEINRLAVQVATNKEGVGQNARAIEGLERSLEKTAREFQRSLEAFDRSCDAKVNRLQVAFDKSVADLQRSIDRSAEDDNKRLQKIEDKIDAQEAERRVPLAAKLTLVVAATGPFITALLLEATR